MNPFALDHSAAASKQALKLIFPTGRTRREIVSVSSHVKSAKAFLRRSLPRFVLELLGSKRTLLTHSYAQEGEDKILASLLGYPERQCPGFYVDVGAHHPERFSNTLLFYRMGWSGINIDAMPGSMAIFRQKRSRDINLEVAVAAENQTLIYYEFNESTLNGFSKELSAQREAFERWKILAEKEIKTIRLDDLLTQHIRDGQRIDFMTVDVEGLDFDVLKSNDWEKFRPAVVLVEDGESLWLGGEADSKIGNFMRTLGYRRCCKTPLTTFFIDEKEFEVTPQGIRLRTSSKS